MHLKDKLTAKILSSSKTQQVLDYQDEQTLQINKRL